MTYLLDTDTISFYVKRHPNVLKHFSQVDRSEIVISSVSTMEVEYGFMLNPQSRQRYESIFQQLIGEVQLTDFTVLDAFFTSKIRAELRSQPTGKYDILLAGTAIARDLILLTNNTKDFARIEGLKLENWMQG